LVDGGLSRHVGAPVVRGTLAEKEKKKKEKKKKKNSEDEQEVIYEANTECDADEERPIRPLTCEADRRQVNSSEVNEVGPCHPHLVQELSGNGRWKWWQY
jgi:hypothetical protein